MLDPSFSVGPVVAGAVGVVIANKDCTLEMLPLTEREMSPKDPLTMETKVDPFTILLDDPGGKCK